MSEEIRVLVCGGRAYSQAWRVFEALEMVSRNHNGKIVVIEGGASGADHFAHKWAREAIDHGLDVEHIQFPADWKTHHSNAGNIRNGEMIKEGNPHVILAFPGGRGTRNMVSQARHAGIPVIYAEDLPEIQKSLGAVTRVDK